MPDKEFIKNKMGNLKNYFNYCESLKKILEEDPNKKNNHQIQLNKLNNIDSELNDIDLFIDFFDEMNGILSEYESKNKDIEQKIKNIKKNKIKIFV